MAKNKQAVKKAPEVAVEATPAADGKKVVTLTAEQTKKVAALPTVSAQIRYLDSEGYARGDIARALGKRYQHVRGVLITPIKSARIV